MFNFVVDQFWCFLWIIIVGCSLHSWFLHCIESKGCLNRRYISIFPYSCRSLLILMFLKRNRVHCWWSRREQSSHASILFWARNFFSAPFPSPQVKKRVFFLHYTLYNVVYYTFEMSFCINAARKQKKFKESAIFSLCWHMKQSAIKVK